MDVTPGSFPAALSTLSQPASKSSLLPANQPLPPGPRSLLPPGGISPALSDFIEFQTMIAASRNLHFKNNGRVSVAKTSFISGVSAGLITLLFSLPGILKGKADTIFLTPIIGTIAALHGILVGLLLNHNRD